MKVRSSNKRLTRPLSVELRAVSKLIPDLRNARQHDTKQIGQIAKSIQAFGFNVPILIDRQLRVIAGHGRLEAAKYLGMREVPTIRLDHLSETQRRAYMLADNRLTEISTWNERMLGEELKFLSESELDFSVDATGFEIAEIDLLIKGLEEEPEVDEADSVPELSKTAVSKREDLWLLGKHRVLCSDALVATNLDRLMDGERANAVFVDPPLT